MGKKFGKVNKIKVDPLAYNLGLIGESGIGKSTIIKEACEQLTGFNPDAYMLWNMGMEDGVDAIVNASYEDIEDWDKLEEVVEDIVENKLTDYADLRVVVVDTVDELFRITEPEVIRLHNKAYPDKPVKTIKAAFGGYQAGEDKAIEIVLEKVKELKDVGVSVWFVGHTKKRTLTDVATGLEYDMLTTNMSAKYFNAIKTKLHVLGVASINRDITQTKSDKKGFDGKVKMVGSVNSATRKITFRDDNFNIDSKSRFPNIVDEIDFSKDSLIKALNDAIEAEFVKQDGGKLDLNKERERQEKEKQEKAEQAVEKAQVEINEKRLEKTISLISNYLKEHKGNKEVLTPIVLKLKELGHSRVTDIKSLDEAEEMLTLCK
jgi:hypothetical protein